MIRQGVSSPHRLVSSKARKPIFFVEPTGAGIARIRMRRAEGFDLQQPGNVTGNGNITPRTPLIGHAPPPGWTEHQPRERVATRRSIRRITRDTSFRRLIRLIVKIFRRRLISEVGTIRDGTDNSHNNRVEAR